MESLFTYLAQFSVITPEMRESADKICRLFTVPKGQILVHQGETCRYIYFIKTGLLRGYTSAEGKEVTRWFTKENEMATSMYSYITKQPSLETIETVEYSELISIPSESIPALFKRFPELLQSSMHMLEMAFVDLEEHALHMQYLPAKDRYARFRERHPELIQRAPLGQIASLLGITQETLSRIRAAE